MKWVTRERPKVDRVACPWLIKRFIDQTPEFIFLPAADVVKYAAETGATPYDVEGVELTHNGPRCSFDAFLAKYGMTDSALLEIAAIIRGADTAQLDLAPQAAGLLAISLGLSRCFKNDQEQIQAGFVIYDALYAWAKEAKDEAHTWNPQRVS